MKIALLGYGKMGKLIEKLALQKGHEIFLKVDSNNCDTITPKDLAGADVAIEFSIPEAAVKNLKMCFEAGVPVVAGTTGWYSHFLEITEYCKEFDGGLFYASNFSVGVNLVFALNKLLARWIGPYEDYTPSVEEIHHTQKRDFPSGTAVSLANDILANLPREKQWQTFEMGENPDLPVELFPVFYERTENVPGTHHIHYTSAIDRITISHEAFNREGFAFGAILAAEFLKNKKGIYNTSDLFKFNI